MALGRPAADDYQRPSNRAAASEAMQAFMALLGQTDMLAYLAMMAPRLVELHRVLKPTGSLYLHCDPTASHYLKLLMDAIFGPKLFLNEIVWGYRGGGVSKRRFGRKHDTLLLYAKTSKYFFEPQYTEYSAATLKRVKKKGLRVNRTKIDVERGAHMPDWWTDFNSLQTYSPERLGYPTQKPEALLERIISASCPPNGVVLDPFCGCGTAIAVAQRLKRRWIGIDITHLAVNLIRHRLQDIYGPEVDKTYRVVGEPVTVDEAALLAQEDQYQFQWWALSLVGARPAEQKKGADKGIDGRIYFHDEAGGATKQIILSVKAGKTNPAHVRDLRGVIEREDAAMGVLLSFQDPTPAMRSEAADAGFYTSPGWGTTHPRMQLLTVAELLAGQKLDYPHITAKTFKKAPKASEAEPDAPSLFE